MPTPTRTAPKVPTLRDLSLDAIQAIATKLRAQDPGLTKEKAVQKATDTKEGREAYAIYRGQFSALPWPEAVAKMSAARKETRGLPRLTRPAASSAAPATPASDLYGHIREQAVAAAPKGRSESGAIADFLATSDGQKLWAQYNAARRHEERA